MIVAVDGSTDDTVDVLNRMATSYPIRWVFQKNQGSAAASNAAARQARHEILIFLDDDQVASPDLVAAHLDVQERQGPALIQGFYPLAPGYDRRGASILYEHWLLRSMEPVGFQHPMSPEIWSANISVPKEVWRRVGGFDETFKGYGGEDTDFGIRVAALGIPVIFEPRALSYHLHQVGYAATRRQAFSGGKSLVHLARKHATPVESLSGGAIDRSVNRTIGKAWQRAPRTMDVLGRTLTAALWAADLVRVRRLQLGMARVLHPLFSR